MFVPQMALNGRNPSTDIFRWGEERKCHQLAEEEALSAVDSPALASSSARWWHFLSSPQRKITVEGFRPLSAICGTNMLDLGHLW